MRSIWANATLDGQCVSFNLTGIVATREGKEEQEWLRREPGERYERANHEPGQDRRLGIQLT
jgi:hypothetical protein